MAYQRKIGRDTKKPAGKVTAVSSGGVTRGKEVWYVISDGQRCTLETSATSVTVMNDAMDIFSGALKRLAKR